VDSAQEKLLKEANAQAGLPAIVNFREKLKLKTIFARIFSRKSMLIKLI
jgi:hypothetical protein